MSIISVMLGGIIVYFLGAHNTMQTQYYLEKMGIQSWRCRNVQTPISLPPHYAYELTTSTAKLLVLADKITAAHDEKALVEAMIKAMKFPYLEVSGCDYANYPFIILLGESLKIPIFIENFAANEIVTLNGQRCLQTYSADSLLKNKSLKATAWEALKKVIKQLT